MTSIEPGKVSVSETTSQTPNAKVNNEQIKIENSSIFIQNNDDEVFTLDDVHGNAKEILRFGNLGEKLKEYIGKKYDDVKNDVALAIKELVEEFRTANSKPKWNKLDSDGDNKFTFKDEVFKELSERITMSLGSLQARKNEAKGGIDVAAFLESEKALLECSGKLHALMDENKPIDEIAPRLKMLYIEVAFHTMAVTGNRVMTSDVKESISERYDEKYGREDVYQEPKD